jgi:DNA-binding transcriptional LysR family regulator
LVQADRLADLLEERVDLAIPIGNRPDSSLMETKVGAIRTVVCGIPDYFIAHGIPHNWPIF